METRGQSKAKEVEMEESRLAELESHLTRRCSAEIERIRASSSRRSSGTIKPIRLSPFKYSWEEVNERREQGLCIFCEEKETPDHHLKHKGLWLVIVDDQSVDEEALVEPVVEPSSALLMPKGDDTSSVEKKTEMVVLNKKEPMEVEGVKDTEVQETKSDVFHQIEAYETKELQATDEVQVRSMELVVRDQTQEARSVVVPSPVVYSLATSHVWEPGGVRCIQVQETLVQHQRNKREVEEFVVRIGSAIGIGNQTFMAVGGYGKQADRLWEPGGLPTTLTLWNWTSDAVQLHPCTSGRANHVWKPGELEPVMVIDVEATAPNPTVKAITKGVETLQPMLDIEVEALEPNSSVKEMGPSVVKDVQVIDLIHEEGSSPDKENKVPISFLESGYIDDPEVNVLAAESVQDSDHSVFEHSVEAYRINSLFGRAEFSQKRMGNMAVYVENSLSFPTELCAYKLLQESKEDEQRLLRKMLKSWHFKYKLQEQQYMKRQLISRKISSPAIALYISTAEPTDQIRVEVLKHGLLQRRTRSLVPNSQSQSHYRLVLHVISSGIGSDVWVAHQKEKPYVLPVAKVNVLPLTSTAGIDKEIASQTFDKKVSQPEYLPTKKKQMECFKSWRFKFKHQPRRNKSCCMRKQLTYKNWKFKYKERTMLLFEAYLRKHRLHHKRKKLKGSQSWKFKSMTFVLFVLLCFPAVLIITLWSYVVWHGFGTASSSIWHCFIFYLAPLEIQVWDCLHFEGTQG